jgi:GTPase SAR1 family protein
MPRNNRKKIILVGDDSTGKTTALRSLLAQIRPRIDDPQNHLGVQNAAGASDTNVTAKKDTPKENGKSKKREPSTDSSDSSDDDEANEKLREEINSKFTLVI